MSNLFSSFDPSTGIFGLSMNWLSLFSVLILPSVFWNIKSKPIILFQMILNFLSKEISLQNFKGYSSSINLFLVTIFLYILINNLMGLSPYVFTSTSHIAFTLPLGLSVWMGYILFSLTKNTSNFLAHLVPNGTPMLLIPFMVIIELISSCMRPFTLAIRLAANMVAGHLLLVLISTPMSKVFIVMLMMIFPWLMVLIFLELGVAFIQSYVFLSLSSLYIEEINQKNL